MALVDRKEALLNNILGWLDEYEFDRSGEEFIGFTSYEEFEAGQKRIIDAMNEDALAVAELIKNRIVPTSKVCCKEFMVGFPMDGFCFNNRGNYVFLGER